LLSLVEGIIYSSSIVGVTEKEGEKGLNMSFAACCLILGLRQSIKIF
jgi:hypothetical protein